MINCLFSILFRMYLYTTLYTNVCLSLTNYFQRKLIFTYIYIYTYIISFYHSQLYVHWMLSIKVNIKKFCHNHKDQYNGTSRHWCGYITRRKVRLRKKYNKSKYFTCKLVILLKWSL